MTSDEYRRLIRSLLARRWLRVGLLTALTALLYILLGLLLVKGLGWPLLVGNAAAYVLSLAVPYLGQCFVALRPVGGTHREMTLRFLKLQASGLVLNTLLVGMLHLAGLSYGLSLPLVCVLVPVCLAGVCRYWLFRADMGANTGETDPRFLPPAEAGQQLCYVPCSEPPRVSVIMNCLNSSEHLQETLDSLAAQTFTDFEVIFWDNGSTDSSPQIARGHAGLAGRLRYFRSEETVPLGAARNLAIARSRGRYVAFLDCDDLWRPEKLARQVACFEADPHVGLVSTDTEIFDGKHVLKRLFAESRPQRGKAFAALMERQWISMSSAMLSRAALDSVVCPPAREGGAPVWFDESLNVCEEADIFYRVAHDWELDHVDAPLTLWRVHGNNTTFRKFGQFADETLYILEKHRRLWPGYDAAHPELVSLLTRRAAFQKAVSLWREGRGSEARAVIRPWRDGSRKYRLFWWASYLPGACFDLAARLYFALPSVIRRR